MSQLDVVEVTGDAIELESDSEIEEARPARVLKSPMLPTPVEANEHNITHLPFRNWCPWCVKGKAIHIPHKTQGNKVYQVPHIVVDYCFLGDDANEETLIVQVARDLETKYLFAHAVPRTCMGRASW